MYRTFHLPIFVLLLVVACHDPASAPFGLAGRALEYDYGDSAYRIDFVDESTLRWKTLRGAGAGSEAEENYRMHRIDRHRLFLAWVEEDGRGVALVLNFENQRIHTLIKKKRKVVPVDGTFREIEIR